MNCRIGCEFIINPLLTSHFPILKYDLCLNRIDMITGCAFLQPLDLSSPTINDISSATKDGDI